MSPVHSCFCLLIDFLYSAFCNEEHGPKLDHFFCLFFQQLLQPSCLGDGSLSPHPGASGALFLDGLPAVQWLTLPPEIKAQLNCVLI